LLAAPLFYDDHYCNIPGGMPTVDPANLNLVLHQDNPTDPLPQQIQADEYAQYKDARPTPRLIKAKLYTIRVPLSPTPGVMRIGRQITDFPSRVDPNSVPQYTLVGAPFGPNAHQIKPAGTETDPTVPRFHVIAAP
jgi:hypothetical protein